MTHQFKTKDGLNLAYDIKGTGTPVLCLAGLTRNMDDFEPVVTHFASRAQIIRLDSRGRGASDHAPNFLSYTVPQEAQDALALLDHLGLERAAILGTSRGGLIAMTLAVIAKSRLSGVLLNDIGPDIDPKGMAHIMDYLGHPPAFRSYEDAADKLPRALGHSFPTVTRAQWLTYARRVWGESPTRLTLRYDPRLRDAIEAQNVAGPLPDLWPLFEALEGLPLALLRGENSDILSRATMAEMRRHRPDTITREVAGRGHVPFLDEPESLAVIADFLDAVEERTHAH